MPKELITSTTVTDDHVYTRSLHVAWGAKGGRPEAPDGWVNAGFAEIQIRHDDFTAGTLVGIGLDPDEIDHLIDVLKRVKRQACPTPHDEAINLATRNLLVATGMPEVDPVPLAAHLTSLIAARDAINSRA